MVSAEESFAFENEAIDSQKNTKWERSGSDQFIGSANRKVLVDLLAMAALTGIVDFRYNHDIPVEVNAGAVEVSSALKEMYEMLKRAKRSLTVMFEGFIQGLKGSYWQWSSSAIGYQWESNPWSGTYHIIK